MIESLYIFCLGLCFGSFVTMASYRLPRDEEWVVTPSRCPACGARLGFWDLWPVVSWLFNRGRCGHCKARVSVRYPLTELATGLVFLLIYGRYGATLQAALLALMAVALLVMIVSDIEHYIIPDEVHVALVPLGLIYHFVIGTPPESIIGGFLLGAGIGLTLHHGYRRLCKKEGLGYGDVKFLAVAGLWLGVMPIVPFLLFSGLIGIATGLIWRLLGRGQLFPFGPSLAMALFLCVGWPEIPAAFWHMSNYLK